MSSQYQAGGVPWPDGHISDSVYFPIMLSVLLTGAVVAMTCSYIARYGKRGGDRWLHRVLAAVVVIALLVKTGLDIEFVRDTFVDPQVESDQLGVELTVTLAVSYICVVLPQMWLAYRVWLVSEHEMWQTAVGALLVLGSFVSFTGMLIIKRPHWQIFLDATFHHWWIAYAVLIASTDLYLSIAYVLNLLRLRKKSGDPRFKRFLAIMVEIALTSFAPTAAMSLAFAVATIISIENPIFSAFYNLMPALNAVSLLYTLNSRARTSADTAAPTHLTSYANEALTETRHRAGLVHSPGSSMSQSQTAGSVDSHSGNSPWCHVKIEKETRIDEELGDETRPVSPPRLIPRKEPPRFEDV